MTMTLLATATVSLWIAFQFLIISIKFAAKGISVLFTIALILTCRGLVRIGKALYITYKFFALRLGTAYSDFCLINICYYRDQTRYLPTSKERQIAAFDNTEDISIPVMQIESFTQHPVSVTSVVKHTKNTSLVITHLDTVINYTPNNQPNYKNTPPTAIRVDTANRSASVDKSAWRNQIIVRSTNPTEHAIRTSLLPIVKDQYESYRLEQLLPKKWKKLSVRKLQKLCSQINDIKPNTISGHYSRKVNKRLLINKLTLAYNTPTAPQLGAAK